MKRYRLLFVLPALLLFSALPARAADPIADAIGQAAGDYVNDVLKDFNTTKVVGDALKNMGVKDDELPLLLAISKQSKTAPEVIAAMRIGGKSWNDILAATNTPPETIVPAPTTKPGDTAARHGGDTAAPMGPPYGNAWGYYRNHEQKEWKNYKLSDEEAVGMANAKYLAQRHQVPPEEVIRRKARGQSFATVDDEIKKNKRGGGAPAPLVGDTASVRGPGNQKGKDRPVPGNVNNPKGKGGGPGQDAQGQGRGRGKSGQGRGNGGNPGDDASGQGRGNGGGNGRGPK